MKTHVQKTAQFGDLVATVFDMAAQYSADPKEVSRLATGAVTDMLRHARGRLMPASPSAMFTKTVEI